MKHSSDTALGSKRLGAAGAARLGSSSSRGLLAPSQHQGRPRSRLVTSISRYMH